MLLKGKTLVVLGASAEGGIGWVTAEQAAAEGANVVVAARNKEKLAALAEKINGFAVSCDATDPESIANLFKEANDHYGSVDAAVYTPGQVWSIPIKDITPKDLKEAADIHYNGAIYFTQQAGNYMEQGGSVVLMSSISAQHYYSGVATYASAKAALECFARYAAIEYGDQKIRVNCIRPTSTRTPMIAEALKLPGLEEAGVKEIPLGRLGESDDIAQAAIWLSSDRSAYITGVMLAVDGGNHLLRMPLPSELPSAEEIEASFAEVR
ncbi:MAG: SDR family NAD(P)-dependent oxidoreductase [bacterium]